MDWSIDENREALREKCQGQEDAITARAVLYSVFLFDEFCREVGVGQFSYSRFVDWMAENHPMVLEVVRE